jgi:hypothetical protein
MKLHLLLCLLIPVLFACGNNAKTQPGLPASPEAQPKNTPPPLYLEGIYATSTAEGSDVQFLFDNNANTSWQTRPGAGPDEGIMLYFQQPQALSSIEIITPPGSFSEGKAAVIDVVGNGLLLGSGQPNGKITLENKPVKSLYIRIKSTGKESVLTTGDVQVSSFPAQMSASIASLLLRDEKGALLPLAPPVAIPGVATASSTLKPEAAYHTGNLFDGRKEFCWVEGNTQNAGEGATITFNFNNQKINLTALQIWNGYQRSDDHFQSNARLRDFEISAPGGVAKTYTLRDTKAGQRIELATPFNGSELTLTIKSVYPGKRYKDLAISDIVFFDGDKPMVLKTTLPANIQAELKTKIAASPLAGLLNRRLSNSSDPGSDMAEIQSIILRSDGTFVYYNQLGDPNNEMPDGEQHTYADGNWELLRADAKTATVKIFGQWTDVANLMDYYKGVTKEEVTTIFNDVLTVEKNQLRGTKMLGTFIF